MQYMGTLVTLFLQFAEKFFIPAGITHETSCSPYGEYRYKVVLV